MPQITLDIPDNKLAFFMELVKNLGFVKLSGTSGLLSEEQVRLVEDARKKARENPENATDWELAMGKIDWDAR